MTATRNDSSPRTLQREGPEGLRAARAVDDDHALTDGTSGDVEAFTRLVERHGPACLAVARQVLRDEGMAQDTVQHVYLELWRNASLFDPTRSPIGPWLVMRTHHRAVDRVRQERKRARPHDEIPDLTSEFDLDEHSTTTILGEQTVELLRELPEGQRQCLMLAYWGGYTMTEIARRPDIPEATVKAQSRAALGSLKVLIREQGLDPRLDPCAGQDREGVNDHDQALTTDKADQAEHPPAARDGRARQRDQTAGVRDNEAGDRNMQADLRDVAAAHRDELADDRLATAPEQLLDLYLSSRQSARADRSRAAADRHAEAEDRYAADRDRHDAAADRQASAKDRLEASLDPLTGAYTRAEGFKNLRLQIASARRARQALTLAFLDVDGLKAINDARGHEAGDQALVHVVTALRTHLRPRDLIMRFGGDEFLCALTATDETEVTERLAHVSNTLAQTPEQLSITIGFATLGPQESIDDLFRRADAAFYDTRKRR